MPSFRPIVVKKHTQTEKARERGLWIVLFCFVVEIIVGKLMFMFICEWLSSEAAGAGAEEFLFISNQPFGSSSSQIKALDERIRTAKCEL